MPVDAISSIGATSVRQVIPNETGAALPIPGSGPADGKSFGQFLTELKATVDNYRREFDR